MKNYLKLVHFELTRFKWIYVSLFIITLLMQLGGLLYYTQTWMSTIQRRMVDENLTEAAYVMMYGKINFLQYTERSLWFLGAIALCIVALMLYVFFIWYRDWLGKNMFIYRLLMLPSARSNIFLAKASVILLSILGLITYQILMLPVLNRVFETTIPSIFRDSLSIFDVILINPVLSILFPQSFIEFVIYYGAGMMGVIVIFTAILLERSYRWKGLLTGIIYTGAMSIGFFYLLYLLIESYLYPVEIFLFLVIAGLIITAISMWLSFYLLNRKVNV